MNESIAEKNIAINSTEKNNNFEIEIIGESNVNNIVPTQDALDMDSGFQSRPESVNETIKKGIYKKAQNINNVTLVTPKLQRINESVSKVFGINDPPPGFGLCYPKYYYLEQKRPQPMSPLKVWRGFNGNIYFEPIVCNKLKRSTSFQHYENIIFDQEKPDDLNKLTNKNKKEVSNLDVNDFKDKVNESSEYFLTQPHLNSEIIFNNKNQDISPLFPILSNNHSNSNENSPLKDIDEMSINNYNNSTYIKTKIPPNNSPNIFTTKDIKFSDSYQEKFKNSNSIKSNKDIKPILPNLSAVKKNNLPLRGLAYREVKNRILNINNDSFNDKTPSLYQNNKRDLGSSLLENQFINNTSESLNKHPYKDMLKGIKRGITINYLGKAHTTIDMSDTKSNVKLVEIVPNNSAITKNSDQHDEIEDKNNNNNNLNNSKVNPTVRKINKNCSNFLNIKGDKILKINLSTNEKISNSDLNSCENSGILLKINSEINKFDNSNKTIIENSKSYLNSNSLAESSLKVNLNLVNSLTKLSIPFRKVNQVSDS